MGITPLPTQTALWHGLNDLPNQQDLFDCDLGPAKEVTNHDYQYDPDEPYTLGADDDHDAE